MQFKRRNVYNFLLGFTLSGIIISAGCITGNVIIENKLDKVSTFIEDCELEALKIKSEHLGIEFYEFREQELNKLEQEKKLNNIDDFTYIANKAYIHSAIFENKYLEENFQTEYNKIKPLIEAININKEKVNKLNITADVLSSVAMGKLVLSSYTSAMLFNTKKDDELEK